MNGIYHVDISRGELGGMPCFLATITGPGLPGNGDHRASADVWELLCTDIGMAIQEANPEFTAPVRPEFTAPSPWLIPDPAGFRERRRQRRHSRRLPGTR